MQLVGKLVTKRMIFEGHGRSFVGRWSRDIVFCTCVNAKT
ncbi:hypothetical protein roselon_02036 [Roseibacterium elongatum DSM 19469]|uniref:Uncharacterized protein n=1 Tax=Roseicyclus elongatus DSM 19469 TaxID=1294273 RepID=W8S2F7_9RHOB|nr:hypothetical protein roselon_02036 [Roseibacterium elongatum DSM 19469]